MGWVEGVSRALRHPQSQLGPETQAKTGPLAYSNSSRHGCRNVPYGIPLRGMAYENMVRPYEYFVWVIPLHGMYRL